MEWDEKGNSSLCFKMPDLSTSKRRTSETWRITSTITSSRMEIGRYSDGFRDSITKGSEGKQRSLGDCGSFDQVSSFLAIQSWTVDRTVSGEVHERDCAFARSTSYNRIVQRHAIPIAFLGQFTEESRDKIEVYLTLPSADRWTVRENHPDSRRYA